MSQRSRQILADAERVLLEPERTFGSSKGNFGSNLQSRLTDPQGQKPDSNVPKRVLPAMVCYKWIKWSLSMFQMGKAWLRPRWFAGGHQRNLYVDCSEDEAWTRGAPDSWVDSCSGCSHQREVTEWLWVTCPSWCLKCNYYIVLYTYGIIWKSICSSSWAFSLLPTGQRRHKHKRCVWNGRRRCCSDGWVVFSSGNHIGSTRYQHIP